MLIIKTVQPYIVFQEDSVLTALNKIGANRAQIVFAVTESGVVEGCLSDGDFRRWITGQSNIDLNQPVKTAINTDFSYRYVDQAPGEIDQGFADDITILPLLDRQRRIVAIATRTRSGLAVGPITISRNDPCFIISEIGNNHNGSLDRAKQLIDESVKAGADCCKFQMRDLNSLYVDGEKAAKAADLGAEYTLDLLTRFQLESDELFEAFDYARQQGVIALCTPWDRESLRLLEEYGMEAYKVASADLTNHDFLGDLAGVGRPLICSTGMSSESEIIESVEFLRKRGAQYALLHCNSTYPTPFKDVNLRYLERLEKISGTFVGYSGHERGIAVPIAAVAKGAKIIEKHFTLDRTMEGNDHRVSLLPNEFSAMVEGIRSVEEAMGSGANRTLSQGERLNREVLAKSLVINRDIAAGIRITRDMIDIKSPGHGLQPNFLEKVVGTIAKRTFHDGDFLFASDLEAPEVLARPYQFSRPFGLPVRYHDLETLVGKSNLDFVEFHLSYRDLDIDIHECFSKSYELGFAVHAPELYSGDHVLDLASTDESYRRRSVDELNRVTSITRAMKEFFPLTERPIIIVNVGGHSKSGWITEEERRSLYDGVWRSLSEVNQEGVEIVVQTMPPFPWHFGGQSFHNLFVAPTEILKFCEEHDFRICFDSSHSLLACNYFDWSFRDFIKTVGSFAAHLHVVDASGVDQEGLQIGEGDLNLEEFGADLKAFSPGTPFIPEIWQGHKNGGEGFWRALEKLEGYL